MSKEHLAGVKPEMSISDPALFDLYRRASDYGTYESRSLKDIKDVSDKIGQKLDELGVLNVSCDLKLYQAWLSATKVRESYTEVDQARSAMRRIASLIFESDGFQNASEKWNQSQG